MQNEALRAQRLRVGLLMGTATFAHAFENGCTTAEALAINDNGPFPLLSLALS